MKSKKSLVVPILLLAGAAVLPLWKLVFGREMFFLSDAFYQHYPWQSVISRLLAQAPGRLPLWNPDMFCGSPVLADPQFQALYPPTLFYRFLPFASAYGCYITFHIALAVSGMAVFLCSRGISFRAAAIGALGFGMGAHPAMLASMPPVLAAYSWMPWVAYFAGRMAANPAAPGAVGLALSLSWLGLAGSPQYGLYAVLLGAVIMAGDSRGASGSAFKWGGMALLAAIAVVAAAWIPFASYLPETIRASAISWDVQKAGSVAPWNLLSLLTPYSFLSRTDVPAIELGTLWMSLHFVGVIGLALAVAGSVWMWKHSQVRMALGLVALGTALGMGSWLPGIGPFFTAIPPFSHIRHAGLAMGLADFGIAWLAAIGAMEAEKRVGGIGGRKFLDCLVLAIVFIGTIGGVTRIMLGWFTRRMGNYAGIMAANLGLLIYPAGVLSALAVLLWLVRRREIRASGAFTAVGVITFLELMAVRSMFQPVVNPSWLLEPSETETAISRDAAGRDFWRVSISPRHQEFWLEQGRDLQGVSRGIRASFRSNLPAAAGFRDAEGNNPLRPSALSNTLYHAQLSRAPWIEPSRGILSDLGARYFISRGRIPGSGWPIIHDGHVVVYRNPDARTGVWVSTGSGKAGISGKPAAGEWNITADMDGPGVIGISERASKGWRLVSPEKGVGLTTVRWGVLLGVSVPAGRHHITLRYDPPAAKIGMGIGFLALALLACWGAFSTFRKPKAGRAG